MMKCPESGLGWFHHHKGRNLVFCFTSSTQYVSFLPIKGRLFVVEKTTMQFTILLLSASALAAPALGSLVSSQAKNLAKVPVKGKPNLARVAMNPGKAASVPSLRQ